MNTNELLALAHAAKEQPMATAPRDGSEVILRVESRAGIPGRFLVGHYMPGGFCIEDHPEIADGWYFWNGCMFDKASKPIGWWPLPSPAQAAEIERLKVWQAAVRAYANHFKLCPPRDGQRPALEEITSDWLAEGLTQWHDRLCEQAAEIERLRAERDEAIMLAECPGVSSLKTLAQELAHRAARIAELERDGEATRDKLLAEIAALQDSLAAMWREKVGRDGAIRVPDESKEI